MYEKLEENGEDNAEENGEDNAEEVDVNLSGLELEMRTMAVARLLPSLLPQNCHLIRSEKSHAQYITMLITTLMGILLTILMILKKDV